MNTKKNKSKNKLRPVPLNPNPPPTEETNVGKTENIKDEKQEVVTKSEERVPKILSESVSPFVEEKDDEFEAPKKPKRNRGKKKKNENVDGEDLKEKKGTKGITDECVVKSDLKEDQKAGSSKQETELKNVTPATRKKKNKQSSESEESKPIVTEKSEVATKILNTKETYPSQEILIKESLEAEIKAPKKKSKKKKRFDSEKSDNNDEVISCTAAFQKILEPKDDKKELKRDDTVNEPKEPVEVITVDSAIELTTSKEIEKKTKKNKCNDSEKPEKTEEFISSTAEFTEILESNDDQKDIKAQHNVSEPNKPYEISNPESASELSTVIKNKKIATQNVEVKIAEKTKEENKSKNSNKKNQKDQIQILEGDIAEDSRRNLEPKVLEDTQEKKLESNESKTQTYESNVSFRENICTPKPTIAKPVEKKSKNESKEIINVTTDCQISEGNIDVVEQMPVITKIDEESYTKIIQENPLPIIETDPATENTRTEAIQASTDKLGKRRKKSPKPPQNYKTTVSKEIKCNQPEANATFPSESSTSKNITFETKLLKSDLETPEVSTLPTLMIVDVSNQPESEYVPTKLVEQNYLKTETSTNIPESECKLNPMQTKDDKKKKKQSPKMSKKMESLEERKLKSLEATEKNKPEESKGEKCKDMSNSLSFTPLLENIEITSVKAGESEGSVCDIVPDVQYPRASSLDNNNNIIIQDITGELSERLNIPINVLNTPLITGSGETPIATPEVVASDITVSEINTITLKSSEEKTDLKSKVMEVNKDMEDLRLSIERSLAEFTAIEKSEKELEKSFEESQNKTKIIKTETENKDVAFVEKELPIFSLKEKTQDENVKPTTIPIETLTPPVYPARKDNKGKGKSKKKGKQDIEQHTNNSASSTTTEITTESSVATGITTVSSESKDTSKEKEEKSDKNSEQEKGKQQCDSAVQDTSTSAEKTDYEPIENFEDAMHSSTDDVNKTFEMIANEDKIVTEEDGYKIKLEAQNNCEINVTAPKEEDEKADNDKINPVSQPKNLLGHPDIPVRLNKTDFKKEKHKTPNARKARVNVKDSVPIDKESKESQTEFKRKCLKEKPNVDDTVNCTTSENEEFVYKYSFRKVFLPSACHVCKKELKARFLCSYCNLVFYCSPKHQDEDYAQHQGFCFAVSTIAHLKTQKHIYADAHNITGHDYRLLRMQMIVSCEKVLKRKLTPCEQEILLYPRICADVGCREWQHTRLKDCDGCGQISFCIDRPDHFPKSHQRWCKSYTLYQKLVMHQQTLGRLEPRLPTRVMMGTYRIPDKINVVLASMYEEKIDMNDIQYASLTQIATAPLTAAYCQQLYTSNMNSTYANGVRKMSTYTLHVVGAELQFEADALNKWEVFFLHLKPDITELRVVLIGHDLNPSNLPLELLGKIRLCENCRQNKRRVIFDFQDGKSYHEYWSTDFITPDLVCAFNPSIQRSSIYNGRDHWASATKSILRLKVPFVVTSYTLIELHRDLARIKEISDIEVNVISEPNYNSFASVRPDRNFISDDEMPLLFKNYCFMLISGAL